MSKGHINLPKPQKIERPQDNGKLKQNIRRNKAKKSARAVMG